MSTEKKKKTKSNKQKTHEEKEDFSCRASKPTNQHKAAMEMDFQSSQQISCSLLSSERRIKPLRKQNTHKTVHTLVQNYYN